MAQKGKADIIIETKDKGSKNISKLQRGLKGLSTVAKKTGSALKAAFVPVTVALGAVTTGMGIAIAKASDLEETSSKFGTVFAGNIDMANKAVQTLTKSYAMSTQEARLHLSSLQDLLVPMGMNADKAAVMSNEVVKLAADLGSFNNLPTEQVMMDIQSALVGNFETMKKYGVVLNESRTKQAAMNMKLWDGKGALDASIKAQVAYQLILDGSQAAVGDMIRTSDGFANTFKLLKARTSDVVAEIGVQLIPIARDLARTMIGVVEKIGVAIKSAIYLFTNWGEATVIFKELWDIALDGMKTNFQNFLNIFMAGGEAITLFMQGRFIEAIATAKEAFEEHNRAAIEGYVAVRDAAFKHFDEISKKADKASKIKIKETIKTNKALAKEDTEDKKKQKEREEWLADAKKNVWSNLTSAFTSLSKLFGDKARAVFETMKVAAIAETTINTYKGVTAAIASMAGAGPIGWIAGGIKAAAILAGGLANVAKISAQNMEFGGIIPGSPGGTLIRAGEKGKAEGILPFEGEGAERLADMGLGATTINMYIDNLFADDEVPQRLAEQIDEALENRRRRGESVFGSGLTTQIALG
jgi:hypothetical protein